MVGKFCKIALTWSFIMFPVLASAVSINSFEKFQENRANFISFDAILHHPLCPHFLSFFIRSTTDTAKPSSIEGQTNLKCKRRLQTDSDSTNEKMTSENYPSSQPSTAYVAPTVPENILTEVPTVVFKEYPTSQPTNTVFVAPTRPEDFVTTMPTVILSSIAEPMKSPVSMKPTVPLPISDGGVIDGSNVAGAENVNEELREEGHTALSSAKYFFFTFLICVGLFAGIHTIKRRCGSGQNLTADMKPKYNLLSMSESAEEEDGGFFSNRNIELANRSSSNSLFDSDRSDSPRSSISNSPHHTSSIG